MVNRTALKPILIVFLLLLLTLPAASQESRKNKVADPDLDAGVLAPGFVLLQDGKGQEALKFFKKAVKRQPESAEAYFGLSWALINLRRYDESLEASQEAVRLKPGYGEAHHHLGMAYERLGRGQEAIPAFKEAIRLKPNAHSYEGLGWAYSKLGRWPEAAAAFGQAVRLNPQEPSLRAALVGSYLAMGDRDAALKEYEVLKNSDPKTAQEVAGQFPGLVD